MRPPPPPVAAAPPRGLHLLTSVAPAVAIAAALVCGAGPVAVAPAAQANPFVRGPPLQGKPFANTPYAESQKLLLGLDKLGFVFLAVVFYFLFLFLSFAYAIGRRCFDTAIVLADALLLIGRCSMRCRKIRPCPSTNPGCVSTNPLGSSSSFASPLLIPESSAGDKAVASLRQAIEKTQKNVSFNVDQDTPYGHYMEVEMDGGVGRDVMEFLVKKDAGVVAYRCLATKVTFVYPFTTAVGDSNGQKQRIAAISQELGWYAPDIQSSMDPGVDQE
ncbi:hypothetical protein EJB05_32043, partial [Eragrostis curvula]